MSSNSSPHSANFNHRCIFSNLLGECEHVAKHLVRVQYPHDLGKKHPGKRDVNRRINPQTKNIAMPAVLFVCTANICRSPMTSAIFKEMLNENQAPGEWQVESAGTWALDGQPAADGSLSVMGERGLDISDHRSQSVNREILHSFDLVLTMEWGHKEALRTEFPEIAKRVYLVSEMADQTSNIDDPYGGPGLGYEETAQKIEELLKVGYEKILQLVVPENE